MRFFLHIIAMLICSATLAQTNQDSLPKSKSLQDIKINATKKFIKKEAGKSTYNVSQTASNTGGTLEDVLRKIPNVRVDQAGKITIQGKQNVSIWIDGKPSPMAEADLNTFIKSIQASSIENIEVINNPEAKYDAQGTGGILHIKLKKERKSGTNGLISAGYGFTNRCNTAVSVNKKEGDWNAFGSYGYQRTYSEHIYKEDRTIQLPDTSYLYNMLNTGNSPNQSHNIKGGLDYFIPQGSISYVFNAIVADNEYNSSATGIWLSPDTSLKLISVPVENAKKNSYSHDFSFRKSLDTMGKEISSALIYSYVPSRSYYYFSADKFNEKAILMPEAAIHQQSTTLNSIHNIIWQLDYATHTKITSKLEMGLKNESTWNKNTFNLYDIKNDVFVLNNTFSNQFDYFENITAGYISMEKQLNPTLFTSIGFRGEYTHIRSNNALVSRNYFNLFPNIRLTKNLTEMRTLGLAITSRIARPNFTQLNNSVFYNDPYSTWQGNPRLRPSTEYILTFNFTDIQKSWMTSIDINGASITDKFSEGTVLDSAGISRSGFYNGSQGYYGSVALYNRFDITSFLDLQMSHTYTLQYFEKLVGINNNEQWGHNYNLWGSLNLKFKKWGNIEVTGWMESGGVFAQGRGYPAGSVDISYKTNIGRSNWSVIANVVNVFNTMNFRWSIQNGGLSTDGKWHVINRALFLTVQYKFGGNNYKRTENQMNQRLFGGGRG